MKQHVINLSSQVTSKHTKRPPVHTTSVLGGLNRAKGLYLQPAPNLISKNQVDEGGQL